MRRLTLFGILAGAGLLALGCAVARTTVLVNDAKFTKADLYGKRVGVLPALGTVGAKFSPAMCNELFETTLREYLGEAKNNIAFVDATVRDLQAKGAMDTFLKTHAAYAVIGKMDRSNVQAFGRQLEKDYLVVPQVLDTEQHRSFLDRDNQQYDATVRVTIYDVETGKTVFAAESRATSSRKGLLPTGSMQKTFRKAFNGILSNL